MSVKSGVKKFGVVMFDDAQDPSSGWAHAEGDRQTRRIAASEDLPQDTIWWTNVSFDVFFFETELHRRSWLRHDRYLVVTQKDVLREWNYDPARLDPATTCQVAATFFARIMLIAYQLAKAVRPGITMDEAFEGETLRSDLRVVLPELEYPRSEAASILRADVAFSEFTPTSMRPLRDSVWAMVRKPRLSHALEMFRTEIPVGPFEFMSRRDIQSHDGNLVSGEGSRPFVAEVAVGEIHPDVATVYGIAPSVGAGRPATRAWVAQNEFAALGRIAELDVKSAWVGRASTSLLEMLPDPVREFLAGDRNACSWSAGIVAETLWRACCLKERRDGAADSGCEHGAATSWAGAWIRAADKISMFSSAMELVRSGYSVASYGTGWVRASITQDMREDFIRDSLATGLVPSMAEIPEGMFQFGDEIIWGGSKKAEALAFMQSRKQRDLLLNLDRASLVVPERAA
jgi:hypothetical protein